MSIARYLKDFSEPQGSALALASTDLDDNIFDAPVMSDDFAPQVVVDLDEERRIAWAQGHEAAMRDADAKTEARIAELQAEHAAIITEMQARHNEENSQRIIAGLRNSADAVASAISEQVAAVLAPVLTEEVTAAAITALADAIREAIPDGEAITLVVRGPHALFHRLEAEPGLGAAMKFVETDDLDLVVEIADSVLVSRLSAWAASLGKVME